MIFNNIAYDIIIYIDFVRVQKCVAVNRVFIKIGFRLIFIGECRWTGECRGPDRNRNQRRQRWCWKARTNRCGERTRHSARRTPDDSDGGGGGSGISEVSGGGGSGISEVSGGGSDGVSGISGGDGTDDSGGNRGGGTDDGHRSNDPGRS